LSKEQEQELATLIHAGDRNALEEMILCNLRLVIKLAKDLGGGGAYTWDLISEGNIGLQIAAKRYEPGREARFCSYACFWIKQRMKRFLSNHSKNVRIPVYLGALAWKARQAAIVISERENRPAAVAEIAKAIGKTEKQTKIALEAEYTYVPLDAPAGEDGDATFHDLIADDSAPVGTEMEQTESAAKLFEHMASLPVREQEILVKRYGLNGDPPRSLEDVGRDYGITRERIRQLQEVAEEKLRAKFTKRFSVETDREKLSGDTLELAKVAIQNRIKASPIVAPVEKTVESLKRERINAKSRLAWYKKKYAIGRHSVEIRNKIEMAETDLALITRDLQIVRDAKPKACETYKPRPGQSLTDSMLHRALEP
jgi:RNA polymerase primary sigma factor